MTRILLVEDDDDLASVVQDMLVFEQYEVERAGTADEADEKLRNLSFDLIIMDVNLPGNLTGIDLCEGYRSRGGASPVIFLTGRDQLHDKERGFRVGGDDYLTKPFQFMELAWRVKALLKRSAAQALPAVAPSGAASSPVSAQTAGSQFAAPAATSTENGSQQLSSKSMLLDLDSFRLLKDGVEIRLTKQEFALMEVFMRNPGRVLTQDFILKQIWSDEKDRTADALRSLLKKLRQKLDNAGKDSVIQNIHGVGYKLSD